MKTFNAQEAGAAAVIIVNNVLGGRRSALGPAADRRVTIPSFMVSRRGRARPPGGDQPERGGRRFNEVTVNVTIERRPERRSRASWTR